jgi:hypothetical protein
MVRRDAHPRAAAITLGTPIVIAAAEKPGMSPEGHHNVIVSLRLSAANCATGLRGFVMDDDVALIWLQDQNQTAAVAASLNANTGPLFIDEVMAGDDLR